MRDYNIAILMVLIVVWGVQSCLAVWKEGRYYRNTVDGFTFVDVQASNIDLEGDIDLSTLYPMYMEMDLYVPGNVLVVDDWRLITIDFKKATAEVVVGCSSCGSTRYREGTGEHAAFFLINSFYQHNSTHVIVADTGNMCLRLVSRITRATSTLIGPCGGDDYVRLSVDGEFRNARVGMPRSLIKLPANRDSYDVAFADYGDIRGIHFTNQTANSMRKNVAFSLIISMTVHPDNQNLYFTFRNHPQPISDRYPIGSSSGVGKMDLQTYTIDIISSGYGGSAASSVFSSQNFGELEQLIFLSENVMMVTDSVKSVISVVDLANDSISSICQPPRMEWINDIVLNRTLRYQSCVKFTTHPGNISECRICTPTSLLAINECDEILVGSIDGLSYINTKGMSAELDPAHGSKIKACQLEFSTPQLPHHIRQYPIYGYAVPIGALVIVGLVLAIVYRNKIRNRIDSSPCFKGCLSHTVEQPYGEMR